MGRLAHKKAIITGGGRGIGWATAQRFLQEGAQVAIIDLLKKENTESLPAHAEGRLSFFQADITNAEELSKVVAEIVDSFGGIDVLVNAAAITGVNKPTHEVSPDEWDAVFRVNVKGSFLCTKYVLPTMMSQRSGAIVNFSSIYGLIGNHDLPPYHATKGAVLMMTKTDAICYASYGIRVNAVHPGSTKTEMFMRAAETYHAGRDAYLSMMLEKHPLCLGEPVDVANCVLFLASDEARFVTGASLVVDGGYTSQ